MGKRVVITGVGIISPVGIGADDFWASILGKKSGIGVIEGLSHSALPGNVGAEVPEFTESTARKQYLKPQRKSVKVMCREIQLGVASAHLAIAHGNLDLETIDHERLGVEFGANQMFSPPEVLSPGCFECEADGKFLFDQWGETGLDRMDPLWLLKYLPNMPACHIGIYADARGPNNSLTLAEASGNSALGEAFRIISGGRADMMLAGSTGTRIHAVKSMHACLWDELACYDDAEPATWSRPFSADRKGQVIGEGACTLILEEEEHARARGANVLGSVLGAGSSCVLSREGEPNHRQALVNAMQTAIRDAGISLSDIGHINAHGLGGRRSDADEAAAIQEVFGDNASTIPVTGCKSFLGNSGAASGTLELAASLLAMKHDLIPATINYTSADESLGLNVVHGEHAAATSKVVLNVSVTSNAQASALVACGV